MPPEDKTVADARRANAARERGYREQALKMLNKRVRHDILAIA